MNEEINGKWNRVLVICERDIPVMVVTVDVRSDDFDLATRNSYLVQWCPCKQRPSIKEIMLRTTNCNITSTEKYKLHMQVLGTANFMYISAFYSTVFQIKLIPDIS